MLSVLERQQVAAGNDCERLEAAMVGRYTETTPQNSQIVQALQGTNQGGLEWLDSGLSLHGFDLARRQRWIIRHNLVLPTHNSPCPLSQYISSDRHYLLVAQQGWKLHGLRRTFAQAL